MSNEAQEVEKVNLNELESPHDVGTIFMNNAAKAGLELNSSDEELKKNAIDTETGDDADKVAAEAKERIDTRVAELQAKEETDLTEDEKSFLSSNTEREEGEEEEGNQLSDKEVEAKIEEIGNKEEADLTDEDRKFVTDNTEDSTLQVFYEELGSPEGVKLEDYEDTVEGVAKMNSDATSLKAVEMSKKLVAQTFEQNPALNKLYIHLNEGKPLETFLLANQKKEYSDIDIAKEEGQKSMISLYHSKLGNSLEEIEDIISGVENRGKLEDRSKEIKALLDTQTKTDIEAKDALAKVQATQQQADSKKYIEDIKTAIASRKLGDIALTENQAKDFESKLFSDDNYINNIYKELPTDKVLLIDYLTVLVNEGRLGEISKFSKGASPKRNSLGKMFDKNSKRAGVISKVKSAGSKKDLAGDNFDDLSNVKIQSFINSN